MSIRIRLAVLALLAVSAASGRAEDNAAGWLGGRWKSNRALSIASIHLQNQLPPEKQARFENLFGQMTIIYTPSEVSYEMPPLEKYPAWSATESYKVTVATADRVVIRSKNPRTAKEQTSIIHFENRDRYWSDLSATPGVTGREYFDRVKSK